MPRRTGFDTLFENTNVPTPEEMQILADGPNEPDLPMDEDDVGQLIEGEAGAFGSDPSKRNEMDDEDYQAAIAKAIEGAEDYIDMELSPDREFAAKYYRGDLFGNEVPGRSQVVMTEVRDTVLAMMPALLRVFCGTKNAVEFMANQGTPDAQAKNQTAYINHIIHHDNPGFSILHGAFKDALVRKTGIITWWHEEKETVTEEILTGLNEEAYALLVMEKQESSSEDENLQFDVEVLKESPDTAAPDEMPDLLDEQAQAPDQGMQMDMLSQMDPDDPATAQAIGAMADQPLEPPQKFIRDVRVVRRVIVKRHRVAAVPPEEFIVSPMATDDIDAFQLVGRRQMKTISELVALGHDEDEIRELIGAGGQNDNLNENSERIDRAGNTVERLFDTGFESVDESSEWVKYCVVYVLIDRDGDGIAERRKICTVGNANHIIYDEMIDEMVPFSLFCPDPEPHTIFGYSIADQTMDMQEISSEIVRGILDSLAESIIGRTAIVEGKVNIDDMLSTERDQIIRMKEQGSVQSLSKPFSGMNAIPVMDYLQTVKARRTGITIAPAGLSADVLQSTSTEAANATVDASQERSEMIARIFAETGMKRLMKGLLQNVVRHQDSKRMIRLMGKGVTMDPRSFNAELDLYANVGLGRGTAAKRIQGLTAIIGKQTEIITQFGLDNPFVKLNHASNSMEDWVREMDFSEPSRYFNLMDEKAAQEYEAKVNSQPPKPTPEELLFKAQQAKTAADLAKNQRSETTKRAKDALDDDFRRDKMEQDFYTKAAELMGKFGLQVDEMEMRKRMGEEADANAMADSVDEQAQAQTQPQDPNAP